MIAEYHLLVQEGFTVSRLDPFTYATTLIQYKGYCQTTCQQWRKGHELEWQQCEWKRAIGRFRRQKGILSNDKRVSLMNHVVFLQHACTLIWYHNAAQLQLKGYSYVYNLLFTL